ncbi:MAG: phosphate ABC transporter substrate-binding protein PstS, partial [Acidobacteriota bacterium]
MFRLWKAPRLTALTFITGLLLLGFACSPGGVTGPGTAQSPITLQGAGATFPNPLYQKWLSEYGKLHPNVRIDYQSIGSGGGIKQIQAETVNFGASDAPMTDDELKGAPAPILHIPTVLGAVVITYNVPSVKEALHLSPEVIADIFLGKIKKWDDPRLKQDNPGANLPAADISVVHRADGSGTTFVFTDYLAKVSAEWKEKVGADKSPKWPVGQGGKGNEGVTGQIKLQPNTIGYVELAYANKNNLPSALVKNGSGKFIAPSIDAVTAAAASASSSMPDDLRVSITSAPGADAYPISSYTYILA